MTNHDFTYKFLPRLAYLYQAGEVPLYALFHHELWREVFPTAGRDLQDGDFLWEGRRFMARSLSDGTLLIIYELPIPQKEGDSRYVALRVQRQERKAIAYTLTRPRFHDIPWHIYQLTLPDGKPHFHSVMPTPNWRHTDFCQAIDAIPFKDSLSDDAPTSFWGKIVDGLGDLFKPQTSTN